ncbi:CHAT domain-containing protein [Nitrosomonas sp.]|uniref:CHAT domain-containing protein n=1 Tax=Nitrosomonas sp. TaxID=42353 RepID=UPI001DE91208|nr:CHAT domain-containing protein [Nitrosomonas sp.]MCB1948807.1 CHAT domain-containing protein [Nitrosomonas sp.]
MSAISHRKNCTLHQGVTARCCIVLLLIANISACISFNNFIDAKHFDRTESERHAGFAAYQKQDYPAALKHYQNALVYLPADNGDALRADLYYKLGRTYLGMQDNPAAIESFEQALVLQNNGSSHDRAILHNMLGLTYQKTGNIKKSRAHLNQAIELRIINHDELGEARTLGNLAATYLAQGRYIKAVEHYHRAQQLFAKTAHATPNDLGNIQTNLGSVYAEMGQYDKALTHQHQAMTIYQQAGNTAGIASSYHNIGYIESEQQNYAVALDAFKQAIALREKIHDRFGAAETRNNLGMLLSEMGRQEDALNILFQALPVLEELNTRIQIAATYDSIGNVYARKQRHTPALEFFQKALLIWHETGDRESERITLANMGDLFALSGQNTLAIVFYKLAVNISEAIREELQVLPQQEQKAYLNRVQGFYRKLADLLLQQDRVIEAQQILDLLKIQEAANFLGPVRGNTSTATGIAMLSPEQQIQKQYALLLEQSIRVGKELAELNNIDRSNRTAAQNEKLLQLIKQEQQLQRGFVSFIESNEIRDLVDQLSRDVRTQMPALEQLRPLRDNLKRLGKQVVLLYPLIMEDRLELVLVTGFTPPLHMAVPIDHHDLNQTVLNFRTALIERQDTVQHFAQKLYQWLIKPVEHLLKEVNAGTILYAPDGVLRYIPLAALHDGQQWLIQRYQINNITAFSLTDLDTRPVKEAKLLAAAFTTGNYTFTIGNQSFDFKGLQYAGEEVNNLAEIYPDTIKLLDKNFNPDAVITEINHFNIIHFATHAALVPGKAYESFILFGNGDRVTVDQVKYEWSLTNVDLIVLSACETALGAVFGQGEEILGLGFLMESAGAKTTLASLWSVDDRGTQLLMNEFYKALRQPGTTKTAALQKAQLTMLSESAISPIADSDRGVQREVDMAPESNQRTAHPYFWAPFILIGNGL